MKLKYKNQTFQNQAVEAVADVFQGQGQGRIINELGRYAELDLFDNNYIVANHLTLSPSQMLDNLHQVQRRQQLPLTYEPPQQFSIEMETGTGKTYVYTKTIYELHRRYGFSKYLIIVPSIAIREGVYKSLQTTEEHFAASYAGTPCHYFIFSSDHLSQVRQFATSSAIEIMIINIDAFKQSRNRIHQAQDKLQGNTAFAYLRHTQPIVIIDEPQSVDNTDKAQEAIAELSPLFILRYSATHRHKINLLYRLNPVDAYRMGLVKSIRVFSPEVRGDFNRAHLRLTRLSARPTFSGRMELDVQLKNGSVRRRTVTIHPGADLWQLSGQRDIYRGMGVLALDCTPGHQGAELSNGEFLPLGDTWGSDSEALRRGQIKRTIATHLDKELELNPKGIKVLSLFFIDEVAKYRNAQGRPGPYAEIFAQCYRELIEQERYAPLRQRYGEDISSMHSGYFSQDGHGGLRNTRGDSQADGDTYNTIMRDKEWLLSLQCPLRFIFSHSALKEGWDNPNVFQVCTLIEQKSRLSCRQKIGRGLRLCVNQEGERQEDRELNVLHVLANESFADFAATLQSELEQESGLRFGYLDVETLASPHSQLGLSWEQAQQLRQFWEKQGYVNGHGKLRADMYQVLYADELALPPELEPKRQELENLLCQITRHPLQEVGESATLPQAHRYAPWLELWEHMMTPPRYRLRYPEAELVKFCTAKVRQMAPLSTGKVFFREAALSLDSSGIDYRESAPAQEHIGADYAITSQQWPDLIEQLSTLGSIKRQTAFDIVYGSGRLQEWQSNPQLFLERCLQIVRNYRYHLLCQGLSLVRQLGQRQYTLTLSDTWTTLQLWRQEGSWSQLQRYAIPSRWSLDTPLGTLNPSLALERIYKGTSEIHLLSGNHARQEELALWLKELPDA